MAVVYIVMFTSHIELKKGNSTSKSGNNLVTEHFILIGIIVLFNCVNIINFENNAKFANNTHEANIHTDKFFKVWQLYSVCYINCFHINLYNCKC